MATDKIPNHILKIDVLWI